MTWRGGLVEAARGPGPYPRCMKQIEISDFGGPEQLQVREAAEPAVGPGEVLVRVAFAGLNPLDHKLRDGSSGTASHLTMPAVLGRELSGTVIGAAEDVDLEALAMPVGTAVFGMRAMDDWRGTYAEVVAIPAGCLAPVRALPTGVPDTAAVPDADALAPWGGLALAGLTALIAVRDCARVSRGDTVLIHGGAGGVGQMLIPLAREAGAAQIWATGRAENAARIRELGAEAIAYDEQDWEVVLDEATAGRGADVILDTHYFATFAPSLEHLADGGRIVVLPTLADLSPAKDRGIEAHIPQLEVSRERLDHLAAGLESGAIDVEIAQILPMDQIADGHRILESGHSRGKLLLDLRGESPQAPGERAARSEA